MLAHRLDLMIVHSPASRPNASPSSRPNDSTSSRPDASRRLDLMLAHRLD